MEIRKGNALIRHYLHMDPTNLDLDEWARAYNEALWINENIAGKVPN